MSEFEDIRPYEDHEVAGVVSRLMQDDRFSEIATYLLMPPPLHGPGLGHLLTKGMLRWKTRGLKTIKQCQLLMGEYFEKLVEATMQELTVAGLEHLAVGESYLFLSNHRDIVLDSSTLNYLLQNAHHETSRIAVGDNLLKNPLAADLMRLNKSFIVERSVTGARAQFNALQKTSSYTRASLEEGNSIWIAQRAGRAKDGYDRTDPALLKMLALAYRDEGGLASMMEHVRLVPVSISYEVDPCAPRKAHELFVMATQGHYEKGVDEDVESIIEGVVGKKGRVHIEIHPCLQGAFDEPEELAFVLDRHIVGGLRVFPTHVECARRIAKCDPSFGMIPDADVALSQSAMDIMLADAAECPEEERPYFLSQYANVIRNRQDLGIASG